MTVTLPIADLEYPLVRILVMPQGHWTDAKQPWEILPATARFNRTGHRYYGRAHGYELDTVDGQVALPDVGAAVFHFDYGEVNNVSYTETTGAAVTNARDLDGYDVRIQLASVPTDVETSANPAITWRTVFLGTVIAQDDDPFVGSSAAGRRTYRCADLLYRTTRWPMNRHSAAARDAANTATETYIHSIGHPGYNYAVQGYYRRLLGNKFSGTYTPTDVYGDAPANLANYIAHTWTGTGYATTWTDLQATNHALASSRLKGEPSLALADGAGSGAGQSSLDLLSAAKFSWSVGLGESCFTFLTRILDRQRGRGLARLTWTELADTTGNITPAITIYPQFAGDLTVTAGDGSMINYYGANTLLTSKAVDLVGDHRVPDNGVNISKNSTATVDYLESFGEPIEVLVTLSPGDDTISGQNTLQKRWGATEEALFNGITTNLIWQRNFDRWRPVWQRWSLPQNWDFNVSDGTGPSSSVSSPVNYFCKDDGTISIFDFATASDTTGVGEPSPLTCRIMCDLPIYEGYDYATSTPVRYDGSTDLVCPPRMPPIILLRDASDSTLFTDMTQLGTGIANDDFGVLVVHGNDQNNGTRFFSDPTVTNLGSNAGGYQCLVVTVGLQLSSRVRIASANLDPSNVPYTALNTPRKKSLYFPGIFLWLADPNAIWSFNYVISTSYNKFPVYRNAANGSPGILRDDRNALASLHALAWQWYSIAHRTGSWTMRDCGLLPSYTDSVLGAVTYPVVGNLVTTIAASGGTYTMNAPITRVTYNHTNGTTTWTVDWNDLDIASS